MAPRAYWKGYLRLSLVTCPIELFPATSQSEKTHFHQINTQTGHRLFLEPAARRRRPSLGLVFVPDLRHALVWLGVADGNQGLAATFASRLHVGVATAKEIS